MGVICFRVIGRDPEKADAANRAIVEAINSSGKSYLTQTKLNGRSTIRVGLGNILTQEEHVLRVWRLIQETASRM